MTDDNKTSGIFFINLSNSFTLTSYFIIATSLFLITACSINSYSSPSKNTTETNPFSNTTYQLPPSLKHLTINSATQLEREIQNANKSNGYVSLDIEDGIYQLDKTLAIKADYIALTSKSGHPENVILQGSMIKNSGTPVLIKVFANHFSIDGITLQNAKFHLIQIAGEHNANYPVIRNCILRDSYQQLFKVTHGSADPKTSSDFGLIENCTFQYSAGIGPNFYIGGIDAHGINGWVIRNNRFNDIASPGERIAEHAIHIWDDSSDNLVENNLIEDCDRGIGFGMGQAAISPNASYSNKGGTIRNNTIIHSDNNDPFADAGITLEDSADTLIENNKIWLGHNYPNAIEYRFLSTKNVVIKNNITNKDIVSRNGAKAKLSNNKTNAKLEDVLKGY